MGEITRSARRFAVAMSAAGAVALIGAGSAGANVPLTRVSADPFTYGPAVDGAPVSHATEVEPDTFAHGSTVVGAFQVARVFDGGGVDIGVARSADGGRTWSGSFMPGMTFSAGAASPFERVSDASVAFDARHNTWLVSSIPLLPSTSVPTVLVNRSTDDGVTWSSPVQMPPPAARRVDLDKNWTVCDNNSSSPFYGHCYTELDNFGQGDLELMSTSTDGGATWSVPIPTAGNDKGLGGQPLVQPDGTVIVPYEALNGKIAAFRSTDGGASWTKSVNVSGIRFHGVAGNLRTSPLPTAEIDRTGNVYVAWEDCRFRKQCASNDIVFSKSSDGVNWSDVARVPIDPVTSTADHFIPGLGVDPTTAGSSAHLALTYYFYPQAACTTTSCRLDVGYISSPDGGAHWGDATQLAGPMTLDQIAPTSQGPMTGDYISTSFSGATATALFPVGQVPAAGQAFDEATYAPTTPLAVATAAQATHAASTAGAGPVTGVGTGETHHALRDD
jgi:hypothetical protein